jgi:phospholipid/cholesterol/gamma-HCH transport system substrate-binding protein
MRAMRQHVLGPYPLDPNLIAQGIPPDSRVDADDRIYAPIEGAPPTPPAPARRRLSRLATSRRCPRMPMVRRASHRPPKRAQPPRRASDTRSTTPKSGEHLGPDGNWYRQSDIGSSGSPARWQDLLPQS